MSGYVYIELMNIEPLRIADDSSSQMGQTTTMHYIPATSLRGLVVSALSQRDDFSELKSRLFSDEVKFLNAYPVIKGEDSATLLLPSPKGFYEDKTTVKGVKKLENVVLHGEFTDGNKRATLGEFCFIEQQGSERVLRYAHISTGSDLKIKINLQAGDEQTVFRNEYILPGNVFGAYIRAEDKELLNTIKSVFKDEIIIGNARTAGLGRCKVLKICDAAGIPYREYALDKDTSGHAYMMLLSHTVMRDSVTGEYCGLDLRTLEKNLGVTNLAIAYCATTGVDVRGYNRKWGVRTPSVMMYEKGSVFKLTYDGVLTAEKMAAVMDQGIGVRTKEGFGRVLFIADYESVCAKEAYDMQRTQNQSGNVLTEEDRKTLKVIAKNYYRSLYRRQSEKYVVDLNFDSEGVKDSKLGKVESFATQYRFNYKEAEANIEKYFVRAREKQEKQRVHSAAQSDITNLDRYVSGVLSWTMGDFERELSIKTKESDRVMGIPKKELISDEELGRMKLELITKVLRYDHKKKGGKN